MRHLPVPAAHPLTAVSDAHSHRGRAADVEFFDLMFDNNKKLCKSLGIKILPYMEIVDGSRGKVDGFTCGPSKLSLLVSKLEDLTAAHADDTIDGTDVSALLQDAD